MTKAATVSVKMFRYCSCRLNKAQKQQSACEHCLLPDSVLDRTNFSGVRSRNEATINMFLPFPANTHGIYKGKNTHFTPKEADMMRWK